MPFADVSSPPVDRSVVRGGPAGGWVRVIGLVAVACAIPGAVFAGNAADNPARSLLAFLGPKPDASPAYAGDQACITCHQAKADSYRRTAHFHTSSLPSAESIHGRFSEGSNILRTANPNLFFMMEATPQGYFQKGVMRTPKLEILERGEQISVVVGSGRKGQTYLFWDDNALFQLPVSYWTELGDWVNSPGYIDGAADFDRPIAPRCLECHASSFESRAPPVNLYNKASLVLGISCEKCHGPGGEHVARYRSATPPRSPADAAIVNPARLSRDRQIDICSLCHAGAGEALTPPLSFTPGAALAGHLVFPQMAPGAHLDVHASQVQLMERSRCFQASPPMTCTTCHDVHAPQRDPAAFAARCLECHKVESCRAFPKQGHAIDRQCVTCHMPLQETAQIISSANGRSLQPKVRNHQIAIYPEVRLP